MKVKSSTATSMEYRFEGEEYPEAVKMARYTYKKRMFYLFFNRKGIIQVDYCPLNKAANSRNYLDQIQKVFENSGGDHSKIIIHDDNAPIRGAKLVQNYYARTGIERMTHPRYSPDLAPNDFWLIRKLKRAMDNKYIENERELYEEVMKILTSIPAQAYARCFDEWLIRMKRCVDREGNYFEYRSRCNNRKN